MPNGGGDNCGTCPFNEPAAEQQAAGHGYCTIRNLEIDVALWTYCRNWHTRSPEPDGPVFVCGHPEPGQTFPRIPLHGTREPRLGGADGECAMCGGPCADGVLRQGIRVQDEEGEKQFCCNGHYVAWWLDRHPDERTDFWQREWPEPDEVP